MIPPGATPRNSVKKRLNTSPMPITTRSASRMRAECRRRAGTPALRSPSARCALRSLSRQGPLDLVGIRTRAVAEVAHELEPDPPDVPDAHHQAVAPAGADDLLEDAGAVHAFERREEPGAEPGRDRRAREDVGARADQQVAVRGPPARDRLAELARAVGAVEAAVDHHDAPLDARVAVQGQVPDLLGGDGVVGGEAVHHDDVPPEEVELVLAQGADVG